MTTSTAINCPHCRTPIDSATLVCPNCGGLVYSEQLNRLAADAQRLEATQPVLAAALWRQTLPLLPPDSAQHASISERAGMLASGFHAPPAVGGRPAAAARPEVRSDSFSTFLLKTGGSMAVSMWLFAGMDGWPFAIAFVLLILIHEMGHVIASWYFGLKQSAPIFLGPFGAVIFLRDAPLNARVEGVVGIAGPVAGTLGALACYALAWHTPYPEAMLAAAIWAFFMNAWNLLPIPPLDGGRAAAALTPFLWAIGVIGIVTAEALFLYRYGTRVLVGLFVLFWVLQNSIVRIRRTLFGGGWKHPYYQTTWMTKALIALTYAGLLAVLIPRIIRFSSFLFG